METNKEQTKRELISKIQIDPANLGYIAGTRIINGSLMLSIESAMEEYAKVQLEKEMGEFAEWVSVNEWTYCYLLSGKKWVNENSEFKTTSELIKLFYER